MFKILASAFSRLIAAVTSPFRMLIIRIQKLFNINLITAKLITPLTKKVRSLITLKPQTRDDYFVVGKWWIYKKLFLTIILVLCAGIFIYFTMFAGKLPDAMPTAASVVTDVEFRFDDMELKDFSGVARILAADGQTVYVGDIDKGVVKGAGSLWNRDGKLLYKGSFDQNAYSGKGIRYYASNLKEYEGDWANNLYNGTGKYYGEGEVLLYDGGFKDGEREGLGKSYSAQGVLLYEGEFYRNMRHGKGTAYYGDGTLQYSGDFYNNQPQGRGSLYSPSGNLLYTGDMYGGQVNYRSLLYSTFADVQASFTETPRVFYTDTDCVFVYEQMGVIITADCRVRVSTWEKNPTVEDDSNFYMPGDYATSPGSYIPAPEDDSQVGQETIDQSSAYNIPPEPAYPDFSGGQSQSGNEQSGNQQSSQPETPGGNAGTYQPLSVGRLRLNQATKTMTSSGLPSVTPVDWYVTQDSQNPNLGDGQEEPKPGQDTSGSSGQIQVQIPSQNPSGSETPSTQTPATSTQETPFQVLEEDGYDASGQQSQSGGIVIRQDPTTGSQNVIQNPSGLPDFVERNHTVYYEIDTNIWQPEDALDADKVQVKKVTVFSSELAAVPVDALKFEDIAPPFIEDCVAIDFIRQRLPTAFHHVLFEANKQNRLFVKINSINYASKIDRQAYQLGELTYRYAYYTADSTAGGESKPLYFSVER